MHDGRVIRKHKRGAGKKAERRQLLEICGRPVEMLSIGAHGTSLR